MGRNEKNLEATSTAYPSVAALTHELGVCEKSARVAIRRGQIPHLRIGRRIILPKAAIADWLKTVGGRGVATE